jgi:hypothetical protein
MRNNAEVTFEGRLLTPLAAWDEGMYAAMLIVRGTDGAQRATPVLGRFASAEQARACALAWGMAHIDELDALSHGHSSARDTREQAV